MGLFSKRLSTHELSPQAGQVALSLDDSSPVEIALENRESDRESSKWELEFADPILADSEQAVVERIDVDELSAMLSDRRSRVRQGLVFWSWMAAAPLAGMAAIMCLMVGAPALSPMFLFALATAYSMRKQATLLHRERTAFRHAHLDNRWLGPVCEALEWPDRHVRSVAELLAVQMLARVKKRDGTSLTDEQLNCLYQRLTVRSARRNPELARAVLRALPYIGTEPSLALVDRLAVRGPRSVRSAAASSVTVLERRLAQLRRDQKCEVQTHETVSARHTRTEENGVETLTDAQREEQALIAAHVDRQMQEFETALKSAQRPEMRVGFLIASWLVIVPYFAITSFILFAQRNVLMGLLTTVLACLSTQLYRLTLTDRHKALARKLAKVDDVRCIGRLAEALEWPDPEIKRFAIVALTRLLKRVKATDKVFQTAGQRANLHRMLTLANARHHAEFLKAILAALEQVGDATAVPYVEQLAKATPVTRGQREVCEAANLCLDFVKNRAELSRSSQTLLRASAPTVMSADTLLRAASAGTAHDAEQLLRADTGTIA